jgi:hypothetical protein
MLKIRLPKNESVLIQLEDTDDSFMVSYGSRKVTVKEMEGFPDDKQRKGTLYEHRFVSKDGGSMIPQTAEAAPVVVETATAETPGDQPAANVV